MKSPFSLSSLVIGIIVFIPALLISIGTAFNFPEAHPFTVIAFPLIAILTLPEVPLQSAVYFLGFPVVLPLISIGLGIAGIIQKEAKKKHAITGIVLTAISIGMYMALGIFA